MEEETLSPGLPLEDGREEMARRVAREEIASLCGLVLRRLQDIGPEDSPVVGPVYVEDLGAIFGEALADFGGSESEPGE